MHVFFVMYSVENFLSSEHCSLKICGVTTRADALGLVKRGVYALGVNFWPLSKRYIDPDVASPWLREVKGEILRVGVFVNAASSFIAEIFHKGLIDVVQLHGDECPDDMMTLKSLGIPCIKAHGIKLPEDLEALATFSQADALLLDTAAPGVYGGTGEVFDWRLVLKAKELLPKMPIILAGGINPGNVRDAIHQTQPAAIDVASGAEISPGIKDFTKVEALLNALR